MFLHKFFNLRKEGKIPENDTNKNSHKHFDVIVGCMWVGKDLHESTVTLLKNFFCENMKLIVTASGENISSL